MPVEFLTEVQKARYGRFANEPSPEELARYFHFDDSDQVLISKRRGVHNRLGFALQLGTVRYLGTFLPNPINVPPGVIAYVGRQLDIPNTSLLPEYMKREATRLEHTAEIRSLYAYQDFNTPPWRFRLSRWLYARTWLSNERPSHLFERATNWLIQRKVLLPGISTLTPLIAQIRERATMRAWQRLAAIPQKSPRRVSSSYFLCVSFRGIITLVTSTS